MKETKNIIVRICYTIFLDRNKTGFAHLFHEIAHYCDLILKVEENVRHIKSGYFN